MSIIILNQNVIYNLCIWCSEPAVHTGTSVHLIQVVQNDKNSSINHKHFIFVFDFCTPNVFFRNVCGHSSSMRSNASVRKAEKKLFS